MTDHNGANLPAKPVLQEAVTQKEDASSHGAAQENRTPPPEFPDVLTTFEVILQGIFTMSDFDPIGEAMRGLDNRIRLRKPAPLPVERLTLSPSHGFILSRVDGACGVGEVLSEMTGESCWTRMPTSWGTASPCSAHICARYRAAGVL